MRAIKFFAFAMLMGIATSASAQFAGSGSSNSGSGFGSSTAELDTKAHFTAEVRLGGIDSEGGFGFTFGGRKEIATLSNFTLAWDFVNIEYTAPFSSPSDLDFLALKTGLRLFTPSFANDNVRLYTNLSMGYNCTLVRAYDGGDEFMDGSHGFGLTFGVGVQVCKKFNVGYSLLYETGFKSKGHFATIGYTF